MRTASSLLARSWLLLSVTCTAGEISALGSAAGDPGNGGDLGPEAEPEDAPEGDPEAEPESEPEAQPETDLESDPEADADPPDEPEEEGGGRRRPGGGEEEEEEDRADTEPAMDDGPSPVEEEDEVTAEALLALTRDCEVLDGTSPFRKHADTAATVDICTLDGALFWNADMDIDCDGGTEEECRNDPWYLPGTAATDSRGRPLDASVLPYVVVPGESNGFDYRDEGLSMGSAVAVIYQGRLAFGVLGDVGPRGNIGEASYAMAEELGIDPDPRTGGVDRGVTYVAFTGERAHVSPIESHDEAVEVGTARAELLLDRN